MGDWSLRTATGANPRSKVWAMPNGGAQAHATPGDMSAGSKARACPRSKGAQIAVNRTKSHLKNSERGLRNFNHKKHRKHKSGKRIWGKARMNTDKHEWAEGRASRDEGRRRPAVRGVCGRRPQATVAKRQLRPTGARPRNIKPLNEPNPNQ